MQRHARNMARPVHSSTQEVSVSMLLMLVDLVIMFKLRDIIGTVHTTKMHTLETVALVATRAKEALTLFQLSMSGPRSSRT